MNNNDAALVNDYMNNFSKEVEGWFFPIDMLLFALLNEWQQTVSVQGNIAEIGVYKGKSLVLLALLAREGETIYAMDLFEGDLLPATKNAVSRFVPNKKQEQILYFKEDSANYTLDYLRENFPEPLRFLHIDAGHEHHEVLHTLTLLSPLVADAGVIMMDDYQDREFPGVGSAVLEFCYGDNRSNFVPFLVGANKMYLANPYIAKQIQKYLLQHNLLLDKCRLTRTHDDPVLIALSKLPQLSDKLIRQLNHYDLSTIDTAKIDFLAKKASVLGQQKIS